MLGDGGPVCGTGRPPDRPVPPDRVRTMLEPRQHARELGAKTLRRSWRFRSMPRHRDERSSLMCVVEKVSPLIERCGEQLGSLGDRVEVAGLN